MPAPVSALTGTTSRALPAEAAPRAPAVAARQLAAAQLVRLGGGHARRGSPWWSRQSRSVSSPVAAARAARPPGTRRAPAARGPARYEVTSCSQPCAHRLRDLARSRSRAGPRGTARRSDAEEVHELRASRAAPRPAPGLRLPPGRSAGCSCRRSSARGTPPRAARPAGTARGRLRCPRTSTRPGCLDSSVLHNTSTAPGRRSRRLSASCRPAPAQRVRGGLDRVLRGRRPAGPGRSSAPRRRARPARPSCASSTFFGMSARSFSFSRGRMMVVTPMRCAASSFSLTPPMGSTLPRSVISPVMATSRRTGDLGERRDERRGHGDARPRGRPWGWRPRARGCGRRACG